MIGKASIPWAVLAIPDARQCLIYAGPFLAVAAVWWLYNRMDAILAFLFPHWEWERNLGWLNIKAQKRADAVLRGLGYLFYALLAASLYGIFWGVQAIPADWSKAEAIKLFLERLPVFLVSVGLWMVYLGCTLIPKLRDQHEMEALEKFREEQKELEEERDQIKAARGAGSLPKPRGNSPWRPQRMGDGP